MCEARRLFAGDLETLLASGEDASLPPTPVAAETSSIPSGPSETVAMQSPDGTDRPLGDVNGDMQVTASDALEIINALHRRGAGEGEILDEDQLVDYDVNRDGAVTAADALVVINQLQVAASQSSPTPIVVSVPGYESPRPLPCGCGCGSTGCSACSGETVDSAAASFAESE